MFVYFPHSKKILYQKWYVKMAQYHIGRLVNSFLEMGIAFKCLRRSKGSIAAAYESCSASSSDFREIAFQENKVL
jgi:hypothetical protein